jgi:murein DD-endopeptidase MepM/ murein hydrolase activator NlpD
MLPAIARAIALPAALFATISVLGPALAQTSEEPAPAAESPPAPAERLLVLRNGDTLTGRLAGAGIATEDIHAAAQALATRIAPTSLKPGQLVALRPDPEAPNELLGLSLAVAPGHTILVRRNGAGGFIAEESRAEARRHLVRIEGAVQSGLFDSLRAAGLPPPLALELVRALAHGVDLQRDLQPGDRFAVAFERLRDSEGALLGHGELLHVELVLTDRRIAAWRFAPEGEDEADWYDESGRPLRRAFLRTPLDGAQLTSGFGMRRHPVLGFTRMHQGVDFAAPTGTPVFAAADGVVVSARTERGYGRIVRLRHPGGTETRYAHLSRFARGLRAGQAVRQGQAIGAVGATGLATGPHLHYEIALDGKALDPDGAQIEAADPPTGPALAAFNSARRSLDRQLASLAGRNEVAMAGQ